MAENLPETIPLNNSVKITRSRVDLGQAVKLRLQGWTYQDIGDKQGVTASAIFQRLERLKDFMQDPEATQVFREQETGLLDAVSLELTRALLNKASDEKASVNNLAYAARQTFDMRRMLNDKSTSNINALVQIIQRADKVSLKESNPTGKPDDVPQDVVNDAPLQHPPTDIIQ